MYKKSPREEGLLCAFALCALFSAAKSPVKKIELRNYVFFKCNIIFTYYFTKLDKKYHSPYFVIKFIAQCELS